MARIALSSCGNPNCKELYEIVIDSVDERYVKCPVCSQANPVIDSRHIDGRCRECGRPVDEVGHKWQGDNLTCRK